MINKKLLFLIIILVTVLIALISINFLLPRNPYSDLPINKEDFVPNHKTEVGITDEKIVEKIRIVDKKDLGGGFIEYDIDSETSLNFDRIITKDRVVVFESTGTIADDLEDFPKTSTFIQRFGEPEEKVTGSKAYGEFAVTYIFPTHGIAIISNPYTDSVFEVQRFIPSSLAEYKQKYGYDLNAGVTPHTHQ